MKFSQLVHGLLPHINMHMYKRLIPVPGPLQVTDIEPLVRTRVERPYKVKQARQGGTGTEDGIRMMTVGGGYMERVALRTETS